MGRAPCCDKANVKKGLWSPQEDAKLKSYIEQHGIGGSWISLPQKIGLRRCGKSCRLRWLNYLRPNLKHGEYSEEEDEIICRLYLAIGSRWSSIATQLPGRTDNDIKNYWNTRLKKKLLGKQQKHHRQARRDTAPRQEVTIQENGILPIDQLHLAWLTRMVKLQEAPARGMAEESSGTSTPEESMNWDEMIPFMHPDWAHGEQEIFTMQ
ncbi:hypothetical protein MUK42_10387 [Musa troglodytarum]|uniref:Uncharacterized protein n=1 Tax=Musa troglodytarum TaxID=320322 RepID=A0A9E7GQ15_9LILI|nr:hypothetical protein MUK42_10387 [Musa troglodytarum]